MGLVAAFFVAVFVACYVGLGSMTGLDWSYLESQGNGPSSWADNFPACGGSKQSPISFEPHLIVPIRTQPFTFSGYDDVEALEMVNNGHTVQVNVRGSDWNLPSISGGGLGATYVLEQFHFHWGMQDIQGSEHKYRGYSAPLEMHLVHRRSDFPTISDALDDPTGLAVLGVLFVVSEKDNTVNNLDHVVENLAMVKEPGDRVDIDPFPLTDLLPFESHKFFRYNGSLTTPPCSEAVVWSIFSGFPAISPAQVEAFRELQGDGHGPISGNFRPTQPLNGRVVSIGFGN